MHQRTYGGASVPRQCIAPVTRLPRGGITLKKFPPARLATKNVASH